MPLFFDKNGKAVKLGTSQDTCQYIYFLKPSRMRFWIQFGPKLFYFAGLPWSCPTCFRTSSAKLFESRLMYISNALQTLLITFLAFIGKICMDSKPSALLYSRIWALFLHLNNSFLSKTSQPNCLVLQITDKDFIKIQTTQIQTWKTWKISFF